MDNSKGDTMRSVYTGSSIEINIPNSRLPPPSYDSVFGYMKQHMSKMGKKKHDSNKEEGAQGDDSKDQIQQRESVADSRTQSEANADSTEQPQSRNQRRQKYDNISLLMWCRIFNRPGNCIVILACLLVLPGVLIILGSVYINDCPASSNVPVMDIVDGTLLFVLLLLFLRGTMNDYYKKENQNEKNKVYGTFAPLIIMASFICFIVVAEGIYSLFQSDWVSDSSSDRFCHPVLVYFTFSFVTAVLSIIVLCFILWILDGVLMTPIKQCLANRSKH